VDIYGKDEKADLSPAERKVLKQMAEELKKQAVAAVTRARKEKRE
jgi:hypothetical protein